MNLIINNLIVRSGKVFKSRKVFPKYLPEYSLSTHFLAYYQRQIDRPLKL